MLVPPELELWTVNRSDMPEGAPITLLSERPKQATSIVLNTVVVTEGAVLPLASPDALMGLAVSTLKYALIPPAMRALGETVKVYGPGSAPAVPATFQ